MADFKPSRGPKATAKTAEAPLGLTEDQYEVIKKPTSRTTPEVTDEIKLPDGKLPQGYVWVWNRLDRVNKKLLNNESQDFDPYEFKVYPEDIARWLVAHSEIVGGTGHSYSVGTVRSLAIEGSRDYGKPLGDYKPGEFINRAADPNPIGKGTGGLKTKFKLLEIDSNQ